MRQFPILILLCFVRQLCANPLVPMHPVFIASESLVVTVGPTAARIEGNFHFRSSPAIPQVLRDGDVYLDVPIWIPSRKSGGDETMHAFYQTFTSQNSTITPANQRVFDDAFDFQLTIGNKPQAINGFALSDTSNRKMRSQYRSTWLRDGYEIVYVFITFRPEVLKNDPEFRISYRQPLRLTRSGGEFFYVPNFEHMPAGRDTLDLAKYSMRLSAKNSNGLSFGTLRIRPGASSILPLFHDEPIIAIEPAED